MQKLVASFAASANIPALGAVNNLAFADRCNCPFSWWNYRHAQPSRFFPGSRVVDRRLDSKQLSDRDFLGVKPMTSVV